jgi:hypothetical protein
MGSTIGPNSGPRAGVILIHANSFPLYAVGQKCCRLKDTQPFKYLHYLGFGFGEELSGQEVFSVKNYSAKNFPSE